MPELSAVIITYNEEMFIEQCLASLDGIADEIIVVDSFSTDRTEEICRKFNVKFYSHKFDGFRDQKNYATKLAKHRTVLSLDADEALSEKLKESILAVKNNPRYDGYLFRRRNNFCGKWIRFSQWYPDPQLRLFHADQGKWGEFNLHERFILSNGATVGWLEGDLLHWPFVSLSDHETKMEKYAFTGAVEYHKAGKKASFLTPYIHYIWGFFRSYIINRGILDGRYGFIICSLYASSALKKYRILRQLNRNESTG